MKDEVMERVEAWAHAHEEKMTRELADWVRIPSVRDDATAAPGAPFGLECARMLEHALARAEEMGFQCVNHEGYCLTVSDGEPRADDFGVIPHLDVVPATGEWSFPPFCGEVRNGFVYGRGAHDNKSAAVMGLYLLRALRENQVPLKRKLRLILGMAEETGMQDMTYYLAHNTPPALSLVPDCLYPVNFAQKGWTTGYYSTEVDEDLTEFRAGSSTNEVPGEASAVLHVPYETMRSALDGKERIRVSTQGEGVRVEAEGVSTHSANPEKGLNALGILCRALAEAGVLRERTQQAMELLGRVASDDYGTPVGVACKDEYGSQTTLAVTWARLREGRVEFCINARFALTLDAQEGEKRMHDYFTRHGVWVEETHSKKVTLFDRHSPAVQALQASWKSLTGRGDPPYVTGGGTYSCAFPNAITYGIIGGGFGKCEESILPGRGSAHEKDEYVHASIMTNGLIAYVAALRALDETI